MMRTRYSGFRASIRHAENGITLVEMLISVVLLAMVAGALSAAFVTSITASTSNTQNVHAANDAQLIAAYLVRDAQAAGGSNPGTGLLDGTLGVSVHWVRENGGSDPDAAGCQMVDPTNPPQLVVRFAWADWVNSTTSNLHLVKYYYVPPTSTVKGQLVRLTCVDGVLDGKQTLGTIIGSIPSLPTVTCTPTASCPGRPDLVQLTVSEINAQGSPYTYTLNASLRPSSDVPTQLTSGTAASVPLLALGGGMCSGQSTASDLDVEGNPKLRVYGGVAVDGAGSVGCPPTVFAGSYTYQAAGNPQQTSIADPYASLPTPAGTCPISGGSNPPTIGGIYQPGLYPQPLPAGASLAPGVFVLCTDVPSNITGSGVMLYLAQGALNWAGPTNINITAASSGPYAGVAIWQPASNTTPILVSGNGSITLGTATPAVVPPMGSGLYAPTAEVDLSGTPTVSIGWLVARTILVTGNHTITIGVPPATLPAITAPLSLPAGLVGKPYSQVFSAAGGSGVNEWTATGLPATFSMSTSGLLTGNPVVASSSNPLIIVTDSLGDIYKQTYPLVIAPLPVLTTIVPSSRGQAATNQAITINGSGFVPGSTVVFSGSGISTVSGPTVNGAGTQITMNITVAGNATLGSRDVTITNPDTGTVTVNGAFTVNARPTVASVVPGAAGQGATIVPIVINGGSFVNGATVTFSGAGVTAAITGWTATKLTGTVTITAGAATGLRDVTVTNPDAGNSTGAGFFTVNTGPTITGISPATHTKNASAITVVITGTGFDPAATVQLIKTAGATAPTLTSTTWNSSTQITIVIDIPNKTSTENVVVTNPDGGSATVVGGFAAT